MQTKQAKKNYFTKKCLPKYFKLFMSSFQNMIFDLSRSSILNDAEKTPFSNEKKLFDD